MLEKINEDRKVYDACRRYKFYWSAYQEIKRIDKMYWNKHIRKAYKETEQKLYECLLELLGAILCPENELPVIELETHYDDSFRGFGRCSQFITNTRTLSTTDEHIIKMVSQMVCHLLGEDKK